MRIHGGYYRGHKISRVNNKTTRETSSMVREAVFNMLGPIEGYVLDLFAGSGSYGFTSISLGASKTYFIDNNLKAIKTLKENSLKLKVDEEATIIKDDYTNFLSSNSIKFDYIFLDPPFNFENYSELLKIISYHLNVNGRVILETNKNIQIEDNIDELKLVKSKKYGSKMVNIFIK